MTEESILNRKRTAYILYEGEQSYIFSLKTNPQTSKEKSSIAKNVYDLDDKIILVEISLPDSDYLFKEDIEYKNKNRVVFNLECIIKLIKYEFKSVEYNFDLNDKYSNYFMFGIKFERNETKNNPPGKLLDNNLVELLIYFKFIVNKYIGEVKQLHIEGNVNKIKFIIIDSKYLLKDLILVFKEIFLNDQNSITKEDLLLFTSHFDSIVSKIEEHFDYLFVFILAICLLGIFPQYHFIFTEYSLKTNSFLLNIVCKCPLEIILLIQQEPCLKENMINGVMILISMNIKEGKGSWINLLSSDLLEIIFNANLFILRITEFVGNSSIAKLNKEEFQIMKNFMFKTFTKIEPD